MVFPVNMHLYVYRHVPLDEPIDLLNVAFENPRKLRLLKEGNIGGVPRRVRRAEAHREPTQPAVEKEPYLVPDRATGLMELEELRRVCPGRIWNFVNILHYLGGTLFINTPPG